VKHQIIGPNINLLVFHEDPALPQLRIASDPMQMREVFQGHLRPFGRNTYHIQDCILARVNYRQADHCLLQYNLRLVEAETGQELYQWVTGVIGPGNFAEQMWRAHQTSDRKSEISSAFQTFEPVSFIPKLGMLVRVFPHDLRLLSVPLFIAGPPPEVKRLLLDQFGPGKWHAEAWETELIRYRAEKTVVLRYLVKARDGTTSKREEQRFYLKIYGNERGEQTYQVLRMLWARENAREENFMVAKPIAYLSGAQALIQEEAAGISFQQILVYGADEKAASAARKVAAALAALHLDQIPTTRKRLFCKEVRRVKKNGGTLQSACPHLKKELEAIVGSIVAGLEEVPLGPAHLDLKTDHILLDGSRCTLLDFDSFAEADPILDAARMLAQIVAMRFRFSVPDARLRIAACAFDEEYFNRVPRRWRNRLRVVYASAILRVSLGFLKRQESQWPQTVAALLVEANSSLAGRFWWREA
jgi:hypothetical protein